MAPQSWRVATQLLIGVLLCAPVTINAGIMPTSISEKTLPASAGPLTASFPTYPHASDYAAGMCAGYAFCFPSWNPPVVTEPDVMCPVGYDLTTSGSAPFCVQKTGVCTKGFELSSKGDCCMVRSSDKCYVSWNGCGGGSSAGGLLGALAAQLDVGSICSGSDTYQSVVDGVQMVEVTPGSSWYDGVTNTDFDANAAYYQAAWAASSGANTGGGNMFMGGGGVATTATGQYNGHYGPAATAAAGSWAGGGGADDQLGASAWLQGDDGGMQVLPGGSLVNLGGKLVQVGPVSPLPQAGGMAPQGGGASSPGQQQQQQQQQPAGGADGSSSSSSTTAPQQPPVSATLGNQAAALAALQQQALTGGTYVANAGAGAAAGAAAAPPTSYGLPPLPNRAGGAGGAASGAAARYAGGLSDAGAVTKKLLLLPKITVGGTLKIVAGEIAAKREIIASVLQKKEDFLPKCFNKCCTSDADVVCTRASQTVTYAKPQYICPPGCSLAAPFNKCVCSVGAFTPCRPTDTVCSWGDRPVCAGSASYFGIEACKFIGTLQTQLPKVACPDWYSR